MCERGAVRQHRSRETSGPACQAPGVRSLWVNGFGAGGPLGESVRKAEVSGLAAQGRKTRPSKEGPFLEGPCRVDTGGERGGSADRGRRWPTPVAREVGDQALFPMPSRWQ